ncbi:MAG: twitching motility protein, partial [Verrucomicrobia bacterium]|nr:twitching motility protein [Verrucomicrobiota bacterium]
MELMRGVLKAAVEGGASDVHVKVGAPFVLRINRQLVAIEAPIPTDEWMQAVVAKMVPSHARRKLEEDREVDFSYLEPGVGRFRTNVFQQKGSYALAMRYVKTQVPSFDELGLLPILKDVASSSRGIVLVAGTTGSGKSTTLAAMLEYINATFKKHIITLEDPIEFVFEDNQSVIEQREIGLDTQSFQDGLK